MTTNSPRLSPEASTRLHNIGIQVIAQVTERAKGLATMRGLNDVAEIHVDEALNSLYPGVVSKNRWRAWAGEIGATLFGAGLPGIVYELARPTEGFSRPLLVLFILCFSVGAVLITMDKMQ